MDLGEFLDRLPSYRKSGKGSYMAQCPAHDDRSPSLRITEGNDGRILIYCYAGCSVFEVCDAVQVDVSDLFPPTDRNFPPMRSTKGDDLDDYVVEIYEAHVDQGSRIKASDKERYRQALIRGGKRNGFVDKLLKETS
jgi:hypothetical protein